MEPRVPTASATANVISINTKIQEDASLELQRANEAGPVAADRDQTVDIPPRTLLTEAFLRNEGQREVSIHV